MSNAEELPKPFPFFRLPRELRDLVHSHLLETDELSEPRLDFTTSDVNVLLKHRPCKAALDVSKHFAEEHTEQASRETTIVFKDHADFQWGPPTIRPEWKKLQHMEAFVVAGCTCDESHIREGDPQFCNLFSDIQQNRSWVTKILPEFENLASCTVKLGVELRECDNDVEISWPVLPHGEEATKELELFTKVEGLSWLEVYEVREDGPLDPFYDVPKHDWTEKALRASWTKDGGWKCHVALPKKEAATEKVVDEDADEPETEGAAEASQTETVIEEAVKTPETDPMYGYMEPGYVRSAETERVMRILSVPRFNLDLKEAGIS